MKRSGYLLEPSRSPSIPPSPANFFGREAILDDLLGFAERFASVTLFGAGGMGKTTIALSLLHHDRIATKFGKHRHFMRCDDLPNSIDSFSGRLSDMIDTHHPMNVAQLLAHLALSPLCILVLDGVDSILDPLAPGAAEIATTIEEFGRCQSVFLVATSRMDLRIPDFRRMEVPTLRVDAARDLFYRCGLGRSAAVDNILEQLDFHPLSTDLLASAVCENGWDELGLLKAWKDGSTSILKASGCQSLEDNITSILRTPTIQQLGTAIDDTLNVFVLYPKGLKESKLESTFPQVATIGEAANALCKFSLMYRQDGFIAMFSPFLLHFRDSCYILVPKSGGDITQNSVPNGDVQYIRQSVVDAGASLLFHRFHSCRVAILEGFPTGIRSEHLRDEQPGFSHGSSVILCLCPLISPFVAL